MNTRKFSCPYRTCGIWRLNLNLSLEMEVVSQISLYRRRQPSLGRYLIKTLIYMILDLRFSYSSKNYDK